jgi:hypothetical protein
VSSYGMPTGESVTLGTQDSASAAPSNPCTGLSIAGLVGGLSAISDGETVQWHADCVTGSRVATIPGKTTQRWDLETMGLFGTEGEPAAITNDVNPGVNLTRVGSGLTLAAITPVWT